MGERVGGGQTHERRAGELAEGQLHGLLEGARCPEGGDGLLGPLLVGGQVVAGGEVGCRGAVVDVLAGVGGRREEVAAAHDVVDDVPHLPGLARRRVVELIRLHAGQNTLGNANRLLETLGRHRLPPAVSPPAHRSSRSGDLVEASVSSAS